MATLPKHRGDESPAQGPLCGSAALVADRIRLRRQELHAHNPDAVRLAGVVISALHEAAYRHVPAIRCDRLVRHRDKQLMGERPLDLVDLIAIGEENAQGRAIALAGLRILGLAWGFVLEPVDGQAQRASEAAAEVCDSSGRVGAAMARALGDGRLDPVEADALAPHVEDLRGDVARLDALVNQARLGRPA